ncbi:MAG: hypothetical protein ACLFWL_18750 [Candidatus Brocadiia bacterium]
MKRKFIEFLLVLVLAGAAADGADAIITRKRNVTLGPDKSCAITFRLPENSAPVLFVQGRADTDRASRYAAYFTKRATLPPVSQLAEHCWTMELDGEKLTPKDLDVLRPAEMIFAGSESETAVPISDEKSDTWLLKRDLEYMSISRTDKQASAVGRFAWRPWFVHYYQHTFRLPRLKPGTHTITISVPENRSQVHFRDITVVSAANGVLPWHEDWMKLTFSWQPPQPDQLIEGPLEIRACAGEYEPVSFGLHALKNLPELDVRITNLSAPKNATSITSENAEIFAITPLKRESLGEAGFLARMPFVPKKWQRHSPELLIPLSEKKPALNAGLSQRFYVDIRVPDDQTPGVYRGKINVLSAGKPLLTIPLKLHVLPFKLAPTRSDYWMWRLTWSPIWKPENVACLKDIKQHGYAGLVRTCGASFKFSITEDGEVQVDTSDYKKAVKALKKAGLRLQVADTGIAGSLLKTIANHLNIDTKDPVKDLPTLKEFLRKKIENKRAIKKADQDLKGSEFGPGKDDAAGLDPGENLADELAAEPQAKEPAEKIAARRAARLQKKIRRLAVQGFRKVKRITENMGLKLFVFPVDEPCGTPWKRRWTSYAAGLAKDAGLETFSTRNNFEWDANIDHGACGGRIHRMYEDPRPAKDGFRGELDVSCWPLIGAFRGGKSYHFKGVIDEVRIYNRALSRDEMLRQHKKPAGGKLMAYYSMEGKNPGHVKDASKAGHDATIRGGARRVEGYQGRGISLNGVDQHLDTRPGNDPFDVGEGYSISLWFKGRGCLFGRGYDFYNQGANVRFTTTEQEKRWFRGRGAGQSSRHWQHFTLVFDTKNNIVRSYSWDEPIRRWFRENVRWNYMQIRSMPPKNPRCKTGIMAWFYGNFGVLRHITTFCYDWNTNHLYVVYPKSGNRFNEEGTWYRTIGWEGTREGIDDARYLQTLCREIQRSRGMTRMEAAREVEKFLHPVGAGYDINEVITHFGGYNALRRRVINRILEEKNEE